jgi:hypothetical protein
MLIVELVGNDAPPDSKIAQLVAFNPDNPFTPFIAAAFSIVCVQCARV